MIQDLSILFFYAVLGISLSFCHGHFAWNELLWIGGSWAVLSAASLVSFFKKLPPSKTEYPLFALAGVTITVFSALLYLNPIVYQQLPGIDKDLMTLCLGLNALGAVILLGATLARKTKWVLISGYGMVALLFLARIFVVRSAPAPFIDVFTIDTAAADFLMRGLNPYSQSYPDIYHGAYDYLPGYTYWPAVLYWQTFSRALFGDIRYGYIIADLATAWSLRSIVSDLNWNKGMRAMAPLLWFCFPVALFVLDESWVDVPMVAFAALFLAFALKDRTTLAGISLGLFCATKQYSFFFAIFAGLFVLWQNRQPGWRNWRWKPFRTLVASTIGIMLLMFVPFLVWDWGGFYFNTVSSVIHQNVRLDALSFVSAFIQLRWFTMSFEQSLLLYGLALLVSIIVLYFCSGTKNLRTIGFGATLTYGTTFLFGKTAFCNYYYLLAFFVLAYFAMKPESSELKLRK
jgi:hypothetical protein